MNDNLDESWRELTGDVKAEKKSVGRPATGQNTKVIRVPKDFDRHKAIKMYYDWLPIIEEYRSIVKENPLSVRNEKLIRMLEELGTL